MKTGETISHYKILSRLGAGGMGVVYEAEDTRLGRHVAIKFLPKELSADPDAIQRFMREARSIAALNHPHICTLHDIGTHAGEHFMVMELLEGESLKTRIAAGALPVATVFALGSQLADALDAAHAKGVVHRDIKPANLFITSRGELKVLDFGVAKVSHHGHGAKPDDVTRAAPTDQLTTLGTTLGTVSYMSPEQARGEEIDARSDLFSAGVVLFEMATGKQPFTGATVATIFEGILTKTPARPSSIKSTVPASFDRIVEKALQKDREARYQSAAGLRDDLERRAAAPAPAPAGRSRGKWAAIIGTPLVTAALVGGFFFYKSITTPALTEKDTIVLSTVANRTGDVMFDDTIEEALGVELRQSPFLHVVPDQEIQATLRLMGKDPSAPITGEVGRDLCQRVGARALIGGAIASLGSAYVVTVSAQDCVTGNMLAEDQAQADSKEAVLKTFGSVVTLLRKELGESLASLQRYDAKIESATTPSLDALKSYSQGMKARRTEGDFDSVPFFRRAIELDPNFALAYARLGTVYSNLGRADESKEMTTRAFELRQQASEAERLYIEARYYTTVQVDVDKALESYRLILATYPDDYAALSNSATLLRQRGEFAEAARNSERATQIAPNNPLAWTNLATTYIEMRRFDDAMRALKAGLAVQDSTSMRGSLFAVAVLKGDMALADEQVKAVSGRRDEVDFLLIRVQADTYRGKFQEAGTLIADWQARMEQASRAAGVGRGIMDLAINEALVGFADRARARLAQAIDDDQVDENLAEQQLVLATFFRDAKGAEALAQQAEELLKKRATGPEAAAQLNEVHALAAMAAGKPADAVSAVEPLIWDVTHADQILIWSYAQLDQQHYAEAIRGFTWLIGPQSRKEFSATPAFALASLARAQAASGDKASARKNYQELLTLWKDADADIPLLIAVREEFAKLGS